ncbi:apolipoprotein B-100 isoform X1 [Paramisgurnus dabryanus]|uniref:apolipoprotein B-100 isoform X1 n=1 Tax=Paramisgurnus dabryanus TaxID=90735 RepID=UPI0031F3DA8F
MEIKFGLLMLFAIFTLSKAQDKGDSVAPCLMDKRYKSFHKYEYHYETESLNALNGANNGARVSCKVEIKVPGPCSYIMHTTECTLREVNDVNADGKPVFEPAAGTENFKAAMEKHHLKFTVEGDNNIKLFPEEDELINILNIKRGIISALAVPLLEEEKNKDMPTIYGLCPTDYTVNTRGNITLNRDLSQCDKFKPVKDHTSPLAIITGMHHHLAQLIRSTQTCNYIFDNEKHHMTSGVCTDKHLLEPFSHKEVGVTNIGKQAVTLLGVTKYNDRVFNYNVANVKPLHPDSSVDMSPVQDKDAVVAVVSELAQLSKSSDGHKRAHLAHKLIAVIRRMNAETLTAAVPEALKISQSLTYQALLQCGSPECNRAIMQVFKSWDRSSFEVDAALYGMGLMPRPSRVLVGEMLEMAKLKPSKPIYYAVSNAVRRLYDTEGVTGEIQSVAAHNLERIGDCTGDQENIFLSLKVIGNMADAMKAASSALMSAVIQCINQPIASPPVQRAAVQVFRQIPVPVEGREVLMDVVLDGSAAIQKRVAAYLILMKDPRSAELARLASALHTEGNLQAKSFIISHISNILSSTVPETLKLRQKILDAFQGNDVETLMDPSKFSRFYQMGSLEGNMIFESPEEMPREVMLDMTLNAFGFDMDLVEIGMEGKGFEPLVESLFGVNGFFPDTAMKTIFYAADKMPIQVNDILNNIIPGLRNDRKKRQATQSILREISQNVNKLIENLKAQDSPEALVYLRLLGAELGYLQTKDMEVMACTAGKIIKNLPKMLPNDFLRRLFSSVDNDFFLHYIFMDNEFYLPTGSGFPLRVALSGVFSAGITGGLNFDSHTGEFAFMPSAGIELVTEFGAHFPDYVNSGLEMHTTIYHESGVRAKFSMRNYQVKITVPVPQDPTKIISITNSLLSVVGGKSKTIPAIGKRIDEEQCSVFFPGLKYCKSLQYYDAISNDESPHYTLNGDSKFDIELQATGEVTGYTATITYDSVDETDTVTVGIKADGTSFEGTATLKLNRQMYMASAEFLIPTLHVESKVTANMKLDEELTVEFECNLKLPATTSIQKLTLKYDGKKIEGDVKSNVSCEIQSIISSPIEAMVNSLLDDQITQNQINIHGILVKSVEELGVPFLDEISFPERLFFNVEGGAKYTFGEHYKTMTLLLPWAGELATEAIIPESVSLHVPTLGTAEVSGKLDSNFYNLEADAFVGRNPVEHTSYSAKAQVTGTSPVDLLSLKVEGSAMIERKHGDSVDAYLKTTVTHQLMNVRASVVEELKFSEKTSLKSSSKLEVTSPIGVQISLKHIGQVGVDAEKVSGNVNLEGSFKAGQKHGSAILTQSVSLLLVRPEAKIDTSLKTNSTLYAQNTINAAFTNGELSIWSKTALYKDYLSNIAELTFKESQIALKSDTKSSAFGLKIQNTAEAQVGMDAARVKIETSADLSAERVHSLITGALDANGLMVNSDASARLTGLAASHKANLTINNDGLSSGGTTSLISLLTLDEVQHTFDISYKNLTGTAMCKTTGGIMGMQIRHDTELEIAGHVGRFKNLINLLSESFRFDTTINGTGSLFKFNVDAEAQCYIDVYGMQNSQIQTKAHLKAEPFVFAHSHECKVSSTHDLDRVFIRTKLENKFDTVLNLTEQKSILTVKCEVNDYALNQEISAFNNPERLGLEGSGSIAANNENVSISGFLKYDKKSDSDVTNLPIFSSWSKALDDIRMNLLITFEALKNFLNSENIASKIETLPQQVSNIVSELNFERRLVQLKSYLVALIQNMPESVLTLEDMEDSLKNLRDAFEKLVTKMAYSFMEELETFNELVQGTILNNIVDKLIHEWNAINRQYGISAIIFTVVKNVKHCLSVHTVKQLFGELDVPLFRNVNAVYGNMRALILKSEVDKMIVTVLDEMVEHIKQCKNDKTLQRLAHILKSIQIQTTEFLDEAMTYLRTNDVRQAGKHQNESSTPAIPTFNHFPQTPEIGLSFGKLYSEVNVHSPVYSVRTSADVQDVSERHPNFTASVTSQGTSPYDFSLNYNLDFKAQFSIPEQSQLRLSEALKITGFVIFDQQATLGVNTFASEDSPKQITKASTSDFDAAHINLGNERFVSFETSYNHRMSIAAFLLANEITLNQKGVSYQKASTFSLKLKNEGTGKFALLSFSDEGTHKSKLNFNINLNTAKLAFTGHTESDMMKMKMAANAEGDAQSHFEFDARLETESPFVKNSLAVASGKVVLTDMNVEIRASHDTELDVGGSLNNEVTIVISPRDVLIKFQNEGKSPEAKLQNDFSVVLNPGIHQINSVALVCFEQYYYSHNFTVMNIKEEAGVYTAMGGLYSPKYLFGNALEVPFTEFRFPALKDLIFFEQTALWDDFASTDQPINFDAKLVLEKYKFAPSIPSGLIFSEISFKSSVLSLNAYADYYKKEKYLMHVNATTSSKFEELNAKLDGTTSVNTRVGLNVSTFLSLDNVHIGGSHDGSLTLDKDNYEAVMSVDTVAKINMPTFSVNATHQLCADTKSHPKSTSDLKIKYNFDSPDSHGIGQGDAENHFKLEVAPSFISIESFSKGTNNRTISNNVMVQGSLANEAFISVKTDGLQSTLKTTGNDIFGGDYFKLRYDFNDTLSIRGDLGRVYSVLEIDSKYELTDNVTTILKINHTALGKSDIVPLSSLVAAVEIITSSQNYEDIVRDSETGWKDRIFQHKSKTDSHWYNSSLALFLEYFGEMPEVAFVFEGSYNLTSPSALLDYEFDLHGSIS